MLTTALDAMAALLADETGKPPERWREQLTLSADLLSIDPAALAREVTPEEIAQLKADFRAKRKTVAAWLKKPTA